MTDKSRNYKKLIPYALILIGIFAVGLCYITFTPISREKNKVLYVSQTTTLSDVADSVCTASSCVRATLFRLGAELSGSASRLRHGRYSLSDVSILGLLRNIRNGNQQPVRLTIPIVHTNEDLASFLGRQLKEPADSFLCAFSDTTLLSGYGIKPETVFCLFIPNTYEVYWTISPESLLSRMAKEAKAYWTEERVAKAEALGLTKEEVITLASIVEQETSASSEKSRIAGLYLNRLRKPMLLQADPTVKFAAGDFQLRRVAGAILKTDSPYNTYRYMGLPPGPICIPSVESIEAVLHAEKHSYLYMCANPDFSRTHVFTENYSEHLKIAAAYVRALNERGILK
ncbi:MAG: endolytic transglycosylase MltG [Alloprevotella sp.]|nr:endolytic transglycosylase MltG [Alloprevotella sp.]